uniref:Uncharacterized protein n=1 Tax=Gadus morhua TaxID=8049 RepID=A0A8C5ADY0_GADMO
LLILKTFDRLHNQFRIQSPLWLGYLTRGIEVIRDESRIHTTSMTCIRMKENFTMSGLESLATGRSMGL